MPDLDYVKVTGRFGLTVGDGADPDENPDTVWCDSGTVRLVPLNTYTKITGGIPSPWTAGHSVIEASINIDGYLTWSGQPHVWVVDFSSAKVNPQITDGKATHRVEFKNVMSNGSLVEFGIQNVRLAADSIDPLTGAVDLTLAMPVPTGGGTPIIVGPPGPQGLPGDPTLTDEVTAGNIETGDLTKAAVDARTRVVGDDRYANIARVADIQWPQVIAHVNGGDLAPQESREGLDLAMNTDAILLTEIGDVNPGGDTLVISHDAVHARTTFAVTIADITMAAMRRVKLASSIWFGGNWADTTPMTFDEGLRVVSGRKIGVPENKDAVNPTGTAQRMADLITRRGLQKSMIVSGAGVAGCRVITDAGIDAMYIASTVASSPTPATLVANNIRFACTNFYDAGDVAGWVASMNAVGIKCIAFTIDNQTDYAAALAMGFVGAYSNNPVYVSGQTAFYRKTSTTWGKFGTWVHGMVRRATVGPLAASNRGKIVGLAPDAVFVPIHGFHFLVGELCPVPNPAGTYSLSWKPSAYSMPASGNGASVYFCVATDKPATNGGGAGADILGSYLAKHKAGGDLVLYGIADPYVPTTLGTGKGLAWIAPALSADLPVAATTAIAVAATATLVRQGSRFRIPTTGQIVTLSADAAAGATSLTITSFTPLAVVPAGTVLEQQSIVQAFIDPTNVSIARTDSGIAKIAGSTIASGTTINSITVDDLSRALANDDHIMLSTGQIVRVRAAAALHATSVLFDSVTTTSAMAAGANVYAAARAPAADATKMAVAAAFRGGYIFMNSATAGSEDVGFGDFTRTP